MSALRWWYAADSMRVPDGAWVEVARWAYPRESLPGVGTWFAPAAGSDVWINVGRSIRVPRKADAAHGQRSGLAAAWAAKRNTSASRVNAASARALIAAELGQDPWAHHFFHADVFTFMARTTRATSAPRRPRMPPLI